jgi:hypothetical protein
MYLALRTKILFIFLLLILIMTLIISDAKQYLPAEKSVNTDRIGRTQFQPLSDDWVEILEPATADEDGLITFTDPDFDASKFFSIGDKTWIIQGGDNKYSYIADVEDNTITVISLLLTVHRLTDGDMDKFYFSRMSTPLGHPITLPFIASLSASGSMTIGSVDPDFREMNFFLVGNLMRVFGILEGIDTAGSASSTIYMTLPYEPSIDYIQTPSINYAATTGSGDESIKADYDLVGSPRKAAFSRYNGTNWPIGNNSINIYPDIRYFV